MSKLQAYLPFQGIHLGTLIAGVSAAYVCGGMTYFLGAVLYPDQPALKLILSLFGLAIGYGGAWILAGKFLGRRLLSSQNK